MAILLSAQATDSLFVYFDVKDLDEAKKWLHTQFVEKSLTESQDVDDYLIEQLKVGPGKPERVYTLDLDDFLTGEVRDSMEFVDLFINEGFIAADNRDDVALFLESQQLKIVACGNNENKKHKH